MFFFFFQAEDGIRDRTVTGVQTCALPISGETLPHLRLPTGVVGVAFRWPAVSPGTARGEAGKGVCSVRSSGALLAHHGSDGRGGSVECDHRDGPAQALG